MKPASARLMRALPLAVLVLAVWLGVGFLQDYKRERLGREVAANAKPGDIMMISSETCAYCKEARAWFKANQVSFGECFIERDAGCASAYSSLQAPGTPTLLVRGKRIVGFNAERIGQALRET